MKSQFDKNPDNKKSLIIVNGPSSAGAMKTAYLGMNESEAVSILYLGFDFDAFTFPTEYTESAIRSINFQCDFKEQPWLTDGLCDFLKIDLNNYDRITIWHGDRTSELMLLYFFADYYRKPFYVMDVSKHIAERNAVEPAFLSSDELSDLFGKEILLSQEEVNNLCIKVRNIKNRDTGFHYVNSDGEVINVKPEDYIDIFQSLLKENGGELMISHLIGQIVDKNLKFCSFSFIEKMIVYYLRNGMLKGFWRDDNIPIPTKEAYINLGTDSDSKEFSYGSVIIRLP